MSKIGVDGAVFSLNVMLLIIFFCKIAMGSSKEG